MKKRMFRVSLLLVLLLALLPCVSALGADGQQRVFDDAGLLTSSQVDVLEQRIAEISGEIDMDLAVVTTESNPKSAEDYADEFYYDHGIGFGTDQRGALLLIDMDNREYYIYTQGAMIDVVTDRRLNDLRAQVQDRLSAQDYAGAADLFVTRIHGYAAGGEEPRPNPISPGRLLIYAAIGLGVGVVVCLIVLAKYRFRGQGVPVSLPGERRLASYLQRGCFPQRNHQPAVFPAAASLLGRLRREHDPYRQQRPQSRRRRGKVLAYRRSFRAERRPGTIWFPAFSALFVFELRMGFSQAAGQNIHGLFHKRSGTGQIDTHKAFAVCHKFVPKLDEKPRPGNALLELPVGEPEAAQVNPGKISPLTDGKTSPWADRRANAA